MTFYHFSKFIVAVYYTLLLLLTVPLYIMLSTTKYHNIPYLAAIVDCTHTGYHTASMNTTADILIEDQLVTVTIEHSNT